jgi:hypothetical protein
LNGTTLTGGLLPPDIPAHVHILSARFDLLAED